MALFDPDRYYSVQSDRLGQPDLTILRGLDSVQGYGAVVDANYDRATNTHTQLDMNPAALADGTFAHLDLGVLVTVPEYFVHMVDRPAGVAPEHRHRGHPDPAGGACSGGARRHHRSPPDPGMRTTRGAGAGVDPAASRRARPAPSTSAPSSR